VEVVGESGDLYKSNKKSGTRTISMEKMRKRYVRGCATKRRKNAEMGERTDLNKQKRGHKTNKKICEAGRKKQEKK